jgi:hypothetical protein
LGGEELSLTPEKIETALKNWDKLAEKFPRLKGKKKSMERFSNQFRNFALLQNFGGKFGEVSYHDISNIRYTMSGNIYDKESSPSFSFSAVQKALDMNPNTHSFAPPNAEKRGFKTAGDIISSAYVCEKGLFPEETGFYVSTRVLPEDIMEKVSDRFTNYLNDETSKREARYAREDAAAGAKYSR